ncbi:germination protein YpeB [Acetanaerobacterium elongatum]|uniref:Germination protein YpeB n=1 Tax=Acetanaerobacterium elongatum TaxID=258515 RepID=A0A1H0CLV6_9FIRM|nr:germination protein YpeB [Acetanaerobacterium elongatum]SDN58825.1 germination protein YpeB [Acetanaerobacterium elongatum]
MSRRAKVRTVSLLTVLFLIMGGFIVRGYAQAKDYRTQLEYTYQRALVDLGGNVTEISATLNKSVYAGTPAQLTQLSSKLLRDCDAAKANLSQLPTSAFHLDGTNKFISQAGEYASSLTRKISTSQDVTDTEKQNLLKLLNYAKELEKTINAMKDDIDRGNMDIGKVFQAAKEEGDVTAKEPSVTSGFQTVEENMQGYPTLIYDGPYSDHILEKEPVLLKDAKTVTREDARKRAAWALYASPADLKDDTDENGRMPAYCFIYGSSNISMTKQGNVISYMVNSRAVSEGKLSIKQAGIKAGEYLRRLGIENMVQSYYDTANNICTFNYAYDQNGVVCYPDLIKVGVALDNGEIVSFESRGFITNHKEKRDLPKPKITEEQAKAVISKRLKAGKVRLAVIPSIGLNEVFAYEIRCKGLDDNQNVLVYVNAVTGAEEQILILVETETGVLTI